MMVIYYILLNYYILYLWLHYFVCYICIFDPFSSNLEINTKVMTQTIEYVIFVKCIKIINLYFVSKDVTYI